MNIIWVPRSRWGASAGTEDFIRRRRKVPAEDKTEIHVHHTASVDRDDDTPNRWDYDEAETYMQRLQWVRPDLGPLPYCDNLAVSEDLETVWFFEGRGALTLGAHTGGHNWPGYGVGVFGNFDQADTPAALLAVSAIEWRIAQLRSQGLTNLGSAKNPRGWDAWGHRDTSSKTCPGHSLYPLLEEFDLTGDPMGHPYDSHNDFRKDHDIGSVPSWSPWDDYVNAGGSTVPESGTWAFTRADMAWVWRKFIKPLAERVAELESGAPQVEIETEKVDVVKNVRLLGQ